MSAAEKIEVLDSTVPSQAETARSPKNLLHTIGEMQGALQMMREIIQRSSFIALNAAIEAARTQSQSENFTLVADQVRRQAERTDALSKGLEEDIARLMTDALRAQAVNLTDIAHDVIDKIDRNLFERNCDMQAWAGFSEIVTCAEFAVGKTAEDLTSEEVAKSPIVLAASEKLQSLVGIYQVYVDSFLINNNGIVVAAGRNQNFCGVNMANHECFKKTFESSAIWVTDVAIDFILNAVTVTYNAPVKSHDGKVIGVVSNRFNWGIVQDIIDKMPLLNQSKVYILNSGGTVIGALKGRGQLQDYLYWSEAGANTIEGKSGYTIECSRNGRLSAFGYGHTFGFAAYPGKAWSAVVERPLEITVARFLSEEISRENDSKKNASSMANDNLRRVSSEIQKRVSNINAINNETNMLAVNAAIQAGVAGSEGEAFSVIASEIGQLAKQSEEFVNIINSLTSDLGTCVRNTIFQRLGEAAFDCMDKIDRNLFERYCDIQAFAGFSEIKNFTHSSQQKNVQDVLRRLHEIYEVYHEILLLDAEGTVVSAAIHRELLGQNQADRNWFRDCVSGNVIVTDLYFSKSINDYTVSFAAPVRNSDGAVIGVLTTRFNCQVIYDIMSSTIVGKGSEVFLLNSRGVVIGSPHGEGILERQCSGLRAFRATQKQSFGYTIEPDPSLDNQTCAIGFARTNGYLTYPGKNWSVLIRTLATQEN